MGHCCRNATRNRWDSAQTDRAAPPSLAFELQSEKLHENPGQSRGARRPGRSVDGRRGRDPRERPGQVPRDHREIHRRPPAGIRWTRDRRGIPPEPPDALKPEGIVEELSGALAGGRALLSDLADLFGLEAQRAVVALILIVACGAASALLVVAAWIALMTALAIGTAARLGWEAALGVVAATTVMAAAAFFWAGVRATRWLTFP